MMKTPKTSMGLNQILSFVNFSAALVVAVLFFLPLRNIKIGINKPAANLTTFALDSDESFSTIPPFYFKNMSDSCVALWIQEFLVPLDHLCHKTVVDANSRKLPEDRLEMIGNRLGPPWIDR